MGEDIREEKIVCEHTPNTVFIKRGEKGYVLEIDCVYYMKKNLYHMCNSKKEEEGERECFQFKRRYKLINPR